MSGESNNLDKLAESIADGGSIDWDEIARLPADHELRRLADVYRVVAGVANVHRSGLDEVSRPTEPPASTLGQWGHLVLVRKIGEGAFGEVYHAHDTWLDHPVALKLFKHKVPDRAASLRILHEARKLARVRHPNVVSVHGADSHNGQVGFWMDFVDGMTLSERLRQGRFSAGEAAHVGQEVCRALAAVHQADIVHRDVKAQNVMRASDGGRITLMDFGAGEFISDIAVGVRAQGTPLYLAPELLAGGAATVRSDIYAVGVLLFYLVTIEWPVWGGSLPELIDAHMRGDRRRLRDVRPDLPDWFVSIVEQAIDANTERRFRSAGEMEAALTGGVRQSESRHVAQPHPPLPRVIVGLLAIAIPVITIETMGLLASRTFEGLLRIDQDFAAGPAQYLRVGVQSFVPFLFLWFFALAALGIAAGLRPLFHAPAAALQKRWSAATASLDAETAAALIFLIGLGSWVAICWRASTLFNAITNFSINWPSPSEMVALSSAGRPLYQALGNSSAFLSFVLALAVWQWYPRLESRAAASAHRVRQFKWSTVILMFFIVVAAPAPRRFIYDRFEVVEFANQPAFVIASNEQEVLLYSPQGVQHKRWRVRKDTPALHRTGATAYLFDPR